MDIIYRLRIIFWLLILIIWGIYVYQYISQDLEKEKSTKIILNKSEREQKIQKKNIPSYQPITPQIHISIQTQQNIEKQYNNTTSSNPRIMISKSTDIIDISLPQDHLQDNTDDKNKSNIISIQKQQIKEKIKVPDGFNFKETRHFYLYVENGINIDEIEKEVGYMHGEMMLDLIAFSPWTRDEKVHIYLAKNSAKYQELSGRPAWSGGAANLKEKKIYLYMSYEWKGILAHELTHIYFDSFFGGYDKSPLWLSEGMAVYIQIQRGGAKPMWLKENIEKLASGNFYRLKDIIETKTLDDINEKNIKLWYAQCYTIVYLLIKIQQKDEFYQFCKLIKEGNSISKSLFMAYGKPYTTLAALESIWKFEVKKISENI
ncbi:MAG: hypothetical protein N2Z20_02645 [Elusimicrobiales bacterium]|nr:hypothetical protein [Elusimicrobiales bacterium]